MGYERYTEEFKKSAVQKLLSRGLKSAELIARETGTTTNSLYNGRRLCYKPGDEEVRPSSPGLERGREVASSDRVRRP